MSSLWYIYKDGQQQGPFSWEDLSCQAKTGIMMPDDMIWTEGMIGWTEAKKIMGLLADAPPHLVVKPLQTPPLFIEHKRGGTAYKRRAFRCKKPKGGLVLLFIVLVLILLGGGLFVVIQII